MVVDTATVAAQLPASILAFFWVPGNEEQRAAAHGYRDAFARDYGLVGAARPPVLQLDLAREAPFVIDGA